jgi:ElaB/YqjD/DUF883 family membrane-anchored ribosome-binding protein
MADAIKERLTPALNRLEAIEMNARKARRAAVRGRHAAEDAVADATLSVRRHPIGAVALAAGAGVVAGCVMGFVLGRRGRNADDAFEPWLE